MQKIIKDFQYFIDAHSENLWALGHGLEENFKILVDKPENNLDKYLSCLYEDTPLWFYFLCFDYNLFDYFKERIVLTNDWDYTLLFNVDYIESSPYFLSMSQDIYLSKLTPFCPFDVLLQVFKHIEEVQSGSFNFTFPSESFQHLYLQEQPKSAFFKYAKINLNTSSLSHIFQEDNHVGMDIVHEIIKVDNLRNTLISQLSNARSEDFFYLKIHLFLQYPQYCPLSLQDKFNPTLLHDFVTDIIAHKKNVNKHLLFKIMDKEHLILAVTNQYFSSEELSSFVQDKKIQYHLLDYKFPTKQLSTLHVKTKKI